MCQIHYRTEKKIKKVDCHYEIKDKKQVGTFVQNHLLTQCLYTKVSKKRYSDYIKRNKKVIQSGDC